VWETDQEGVRDRTTVRGKRGEGPVPQKKNGVSSGKRFWQDRRGGRAQPQLALNQLIGRPESVCKAGLVVGAGSENVGRPKKLTKIAKRPSRIRHAALKATHDHVTNTRINWGGAPGRKSKNPETRGKRAERLRLRFDRHKSPPYMPVVQATAFRHLTSEPGAASCRLPRVE